MAFFPKTARILKTSEFDDLLKNGAKTGNRFFGLCVVPKEKRRLGVVVSRKIGGAVKRNRIKRIVRELFRLSPEKFPQGDLIVIAREGANGLSNLLLRKALEGVLTKQK